MEGSGSRDVPEHRKVQELAEMQGGCRGPCSPGGMLLAAPRGQTLHDDPLPGPPLTPGHLS